jgi:hypothetical protein
VEDLSELSYHINCNYYKVPTSILHTNLTENGAEVVASVVFLAYSGLDWEKRKNLSSWVTTVVCSLFSPYINFGNLTKPLETQRVPSIDDGLCTTTIYYYYRVARIAQKAFDPKMPVIRKAQK